MAPRQPSLATLTSFTGGLNLRADQYTLARNETPDCMNVDFDPRGGVRQRRGLSWFANLPNADVAALWEYHNTSGVDQLIAQLGTNIKYLNGASWTNIATMSANPLSAFTFKDLFFCSDGAKVIKWDGATGTVMSDAATHYSPDYDTPTWNVGAGTGTAAFPLARYMAVHNSVAFAAYTTEGGVAHPNRVRFSFANNPQSWLAADYIDIDLEEAGDVIVGIVPFQEHLLVFKRKSVHIVFGYSQQSFSVQKISNDVGCFGPNAYCTSPYGAYFFDPVHGVIEWTGKGLRPLFEPLLPLIDEGHINTTSDSSVHLAWVKNRLWVNYKPSEVLEGVTHNQLVYDPTLAKSGAWTQYDLPIEAMSRYQSSTSAVWYATTSSEVAQSAVLRLENANQPFDILDSGGTQIPIVSRWATPWVDMGQPAVRKRWKRPYVVLAENTTSDIRVDVFKDYIGTEIYRSFTLHVDGATGSPLIWSDPSGSPTEWDISTWGSGAGKRYRVVRGSTLGTSRAVQLMFRGSYVNGVPNTNDWGLDAVTLPWLPRRVT